MAQNAEAVKARISKLDGQLLQSVGKELADLPEMLYDDEPIHAVASGLIDGHNWLLVVTDRRILLTYHGTLGGRQDLELPLSQVKSVSCKTGMLLGELLIDTGGQTKKIKSVQKVHARKVAEEVSRLLHAPKPAAATDAPAGDDTLTRLERLAALHEKGALTEEEFAAQKQAILAPAATVAVPEPAPATENPPAPEPAPKTPPAQPQKKGGCVGKFLKIFGGIFVALLVLGLIVDKFAPNKKGTPAPATEQTAPAAQQAPQTAPAPAPAVPTATYTVLPYSHQATENTSTASRKRARVLLTLNSDAAPVTSENLAATCMAAAQYYAQQTGAQALGVFIYDQPGENWGHTQVASCNYAPDNGGFSGQQGWTWADVQAADRTTTAQEKEIARLWNAMRGDFQKGGSTNEKALSAAIAKKLKISPDDVTLGALFPAKVDFTPFVDVKAAGPTVAPAPAAALTKQQARAEVKALLKELDGFKATPMFKQCIYGCGDKNPATAWNARREALQGQLAQQKDLPVMLKAAPGYLWSLGMAYGKNNAKDIKDYRGMVEEGLTD